MGKRVVITGLGAITSTGNTADEVWTAAKNGVSGIAPITHYDTTDRKVTLAGEVKNADFEAYVDKRELRKMDPFTKFAMVAAVQAMTDAGIAEPAEDEAFETRSRWGVIIASGIGGIGTIADEQMKGSAKGFDRVSPFFIPMSISNMAAGHIAIRYGLHGMCSCTVSACASAGNAIGDAYRHISDGYADLMLCGGAEAAITEVSIGGFTSMKALSHETDPARASIPFDKERNGFVMGEGAGVLVLESYEHAAARGAHIYAELAGYGSNCDAHHITAPMEDGTGAAACMKQALDLAGVAIDQVDYINAHGTSTPMNDRCETKAVKKVFGDYAGKLAISSTKSMTGHLLGASAAVEAVITTKAVQEGFIPPTINYQVPDPDCDLDIVPNVGREAKIRYALSNSFGFGGHNVTLLFGSAEDLSVRMNEI